MSTKFFTNKSQGTLLEKFIGVFNHTNVYFFDAVVGYFRSSGYFRVRPHMSKVSQIRILVGIDVDAITQQYTEKGFEALNFTNEAREDAIKKLKADVETAEYAKDVEDGILGFLEDITSGKLQIKAHPSKTLHAKVYIFRDEYEHTHAGWGTVITGSSNLSEAGLEKNFEFNVELRDHDDVRFALDTFEELWKEGVPLEPQHISELVSKTYLGTPVTPFELFVKFLIVHFGSSIDYDPSVVGDLPTGYKRLKYQVDAVNTGYEKLLKHNGFFLADVVGLGKTLVSLLIARRFQYYNGYNNTNVLIICPPAVEHAWENARKKLNIAHTDIITNGSLHKLQENKKYRKPEEYDLILVDEAHRFRNSETNAYNQLQTLCKTPRTNGGVQEVKDYTKKVILISATPLNNSPADLRNLVLLFQDGRDTTLDSVPNLSNFFGKHIDAYKEARKELERASTQAARAPYMRKIHTIYEDIRNYVIAPLTVRRTRTDLLANEEYSKDLASQQVKFPTVMPPYKVLYLLSTDLNDLFCYSMDTVLGSLHYARYQAIGNLTEALQQRNYPKGTMVSTSLKEIVKTALVKRLDSSFYAFLETLKRYQTANRNMMTMFEEGKIIIAPDLGVNDLFQTKSLDEIVELALDYGLAMDVQTVFTPEDFKSDFHARLTEDQNTLDSLVKQWSAVSTDPKLTEFINRINGELFRIQINPERKLIIFTEAADTAMYLQEELGKALQGKYRLLTVTSENRNKVYQKLVDNFDASVEPTNRKNEIDILITTEVLAEGVNLHRANIIINYDTPWNSTRLMQRIGRVNRVGSTADQILVYNFYPTDQVNHQVNLESRAIMKLQAFHSAMGYDEQVYSTEEQVASYALYDPSAGGEPADERLKYLLWLRKFKEENPERFSKIKRLPNRVRCGKQHAAYTNSSFCYLRNARKEDFLLVGQAGEPQELSFIQAAQLLECPETDRSAALPPHHHQQVTTAVNYFSAMQMRKVTEANALITQVKNPQETKARTLLKKILEAQNLHLTEQEVELLKLGLEAIDKGRFVKMNSQLDKIYREITKQKNTSADALMANYHEAVQHVLRQYPLNTNQETEPENRKTTSSASKPSIILTQSFC